VTGSGVGHDAAAGELPARHTALEDAAALLTGSFLVAWGVVLLHSVRGASGGVAGLAFLVDYLTPVPLGVALVVLNVPFAWLAVRRLGWEFTAKTAVALTLVALLSSWLGRVVTVSMPLVLATSFAGLSLGLGFIVLFRHRGSGGGFGVVALHLQEQRGWRAGWTQLAFDLVVLTASAFVVTGPVLAASVLGAAVLNVTIAMNHRPGRYLAR
jgi:uncharacterized membrane-anchored protein YitT (DUF2179 family)